MIPQITEDTYDFLWTIHGYHYLFLSTWISNEARKHEFLFCMDHGVSHTYISKRSRKKLSKEGANFFSKGFPAYEKSSWREMASITAYFKRALSLDIQGLSNKDLAREFDTLVHRIIGMWDMYFWTEFFLLDDVATIIEQNDTSYDLLSLKEHTRRMGPLKYEQRKLVNRTFYPKDNVLQPFYDEINQRLRLGNSVYSYSYKELIALLKGRKTPIPDRTYHVTGKVFGWKDVLGTDAIKIIRKLRAIDKKSTQIKGVPANNGVAKGHVKKIIFGSYVNYEEEAKHMNKGDILVTLTTGPEMMVACQKAGAIVTDEGGITSHAAIVSRELGIPCIIGTKYATEILQDGDFVEVNATTGIVNVLKRIQ